MKRYTTCKNCKEDMIIHSSSNSRHELENERGRYFNATCEHCNKENEYHVNDVKAKEGSPNMVFIILGGLLVILLLIFCIVSFGLIGVICLTVPGFIYVRLKQSEEKSIQLFNQGEISTTRTA
jgi:hypothetical protein